MTRLFRRLPLPVLLIAPSMAIILFVVLVPLIFSLYTSFTNYRLIRPETLWDWVWFRNYIR
ncbi:MAG: sugar ABC transporter permease, partial [Pseudomonadota bacterium]